MKEFFDSLDARMMSFVKGLRTKAEAQPDLQGVDPADIGSPIFLMLGSLSGCTYKDAESYARGLAETYVVSPKLGRINVYDDKDNGRFVYEVHEGGPERSIIPKVLALLANGKKARIRLTNGATAVIEEANNEVFSLIFQADADGVAKLPGMDYVEDEDITVHHIEEYCSTEPLKELFPENRKLVHIGGVILGVAISLFLLTGGIYTVVSSEILSGDAIFRQAKDGMMAEASDNPVWQMDKARLAAEKDGQSVRTLKKGPTGPGGTAAWSWDLSGALEKAAPATPAPVAPTAAAAVTEGAPVPPAASAKKE